ncbi:helix-turn-helix domain-containing protein [Streptomyces sp. NPDC002701]|uniref:helix-turn-helix domain-containing protein n=1 Tax=Streptomyces sp. NPDC002701 TaxID=3364661 RepID=UPI0036CF8981
MTDKDNLLGDFLRARRELVTPQQVGIPAGGTRRVPGLRREEVAMLAGISAEYYLRLEQGRDRRPSAQVLESLAKALLLDDETSAYLAGLASSRRPRRARTPREVVPSGVAKLVETLHVPAFVEGRYLDVLAVNPLATALSPRLVVGNNRLRDLFLDPAERALFPDWEVATQSLIAGFRQAVGTNIDDPRFIELVGELSLASPQFRRLWARHDIRVRQSGRMRFDHPQVGPLVVNHEKLGITNIEGMMLVMVHADAGSEDEEKLTLLASAALPPAGFSSVDARPRKAGASRSESQANGRNY